MRSAMSFQNFHLPQDRTEGVSSNGGTAKLTNHGTQSHPSNSAVAYCEIANLTLALTIKKLTYSAEKQKMKTITQ